MRLPASTARRSNRVSLVAVAGVNPWTPLLNLPASDSFGDEGGWQGQRGHVLLRLPPETLGAATRRTIEWRLTQSAGFGSAVLRGKVGSSNQSGATGLVEPARQGGFVVPVFGGFALDVRPHVCALGAAMQPEAFYAVGNGSPSIGDWVTSYHATLASDGIQATPGPWVEIGPPPFGATRLQVIAPNVVNDPNAHGAIEAEWLHADGTQAALDFYPARTALQVAPQGFHLRVRTSGAYGGSGATPSILCNWSR